jgi:ferredoxin
MIRKRREERGPHLSVNNDRCRRYGLCVAEAPQLFQLTAGGGLRYRRAVPVAELDSARAAVRTCPMLAILLEER